jgi:hypothetical protein
LEGGNLLAELARQWRGEGRVEGDHRRTPQRSRYKAWLHILLMRAAERFIAHHGRYSQRAATRKIRRGRFRISKVDDHHVSFPPYDVAVSTSDRLHDTNSIVSFR